MTLHPGGKPFVSDRRSCQLRITSHVSSCNPRWLPSSRRYGKVAEWFKAPVLKTGVPARVPWVRIPPFPPTARSRLPHFIARPDMTILSAAASYSSDDPTNSSPRHYPKHANDHDSTERDQQQLWPFAKHTRLCAELIGPNRTMVSDRTCVVEKTGCARESHNDQQHDYLLSLLHFRAAIRKTMFVGNS